MTLPEFLQQGSHGEIRVTGHRIGLVTVVAAYQDGYAPEMIVDHYPTLPLALVYKVIAFYLENCPAVDDYVAAERAEYDRLAALPQPGPSLDELRRRMAARRAAESA